jgi:hypothetical protein
MSEKTLVEISKKLSVLISLTIRQFSDDKEFGTKAKRKLGTGDIARYLADMGLDAKDISAILGAPLASVRTLLTPQRRK